MWALVNLFSQGWAPKETGGAACRFPECPGEMNPGTLWNQLESSMGQSVTEACSIGRRLCVPFRGEGA